MLQSMFYISRNIETEVFFTHHDMALASSPPEVLRRLRQKVEGLCSQDYGYIIQVIAAASAPDQGLLIDRIDIRRDGLFARLKFACITFRPFKNEILPFVVAAVTPDSILGRVGPAEVMVPQEKLGGHGTTVLWRGQEDEYEVMSPDSEETRSIRVGSVVLCRCFEMHVEMNSLMRIIGAIDLELWQLLFLRDEQ